MSVRTSTLLLAALLGGAVMNLAAGARRPLVEHRLLSTGHYREADEAAAAVRTFVPPGASLSALTYNFDTLGELDCAVWFEYRLKWLLYPRHFAIHRFGPETTTVGKRSVPMMDPIGYVDYHPGEYLLFFRVTSPPELPKHGFEVIAHGSMWVLGRVSGR